MPKKTPFESDANIRVGRLIRETRLSRPHLSQQRLAAKVGVTRETINRIENGREAQPLILMKIARELGISPHTLAYRGDLPDGLAHRHVGEALRARRLEMGLTLVQCAAMIDVSASVLSRFERGELCQKLMKGGTKLNPFQSPYSPAYVAALGFDAPRDLSRIISAARERQTREFELVKAEAFVATEKNWQ